MIIGVVFIVVHEPPKFTINAMPEKTLVKNLLNGLYRFVSLAMITYMLKLLNREALL
nr:hypothetical protein [Mangrovimonas yunxiaonensis]